MVLEMRCQTTTYITNQPAEGSIVLRHTAHWYTDPQASLSVYTCNRVIESSVFSISDQKKMFVYVNVHRLSLTGSVVKFL